MNGAIKFLGSAALILTALQAVADTSKEEFYTQTQRAVINLEALDASGIYRPVGTGFFVGDDKGELFVVTARHVAVLGDMRARVASLLTKEQRTDIVELRLPHDKWIFHPNGGDDKTLPVDVAVMKLTSIQDRSVVSFFYCSTHCPEGQYNQLDVKPSPPDQVLVFGFPIEVGFVGFSLKEQRPMMRWGVVALKEDEPFVKVEDNGNEKYCAKGAFIIDARMFPGNSGGPVIVSNPLQQLHLGGLVTATNRALDYGIATPVSQIAETLDIAKLRTPNETGWYKPDDAPPVPPTKKLGSH